MHGMSDAMLAMMYTITGCFVVAFSQLTGKMASDRIHPIFVCGLRFGLAAPLCYGVAVYQTGSWRLALSWQLFLIIGGIGILAWGGGALLFYTLMSRDSMHRIAPICNSVSIWTVALAIFFLGEPFFPALAVVLVLLAIGIVFITPSHADTKRWGPAIPLALLVALMWAINLILTKVFVGDVARPVFVLVKMIWATGFHLTFFPVIKSRITRNGALFCLISAVLLVPGDILLMMGVNGLPASIFSPVFATVIPFGFILSVIILKERPMARNWFGMLLIFAAAAICGFYGAR
jgi:drug/metabolite transporter (DMT)-like permease